VRAWASPVSTGYDVKNSMKSDPPTEPFVRKQRLEHFARDAERAREEYFASQQAIDENTARLRALRLAREAGQSGRKSAPKAHAGTRRKPQAAKGAGGK